MAYPQPPIKDDIIYEQPLNFAISFGWIRQWMNWMKLFHIATLIGPISAKWRDKSKI